MTETPKITIVTPSYNQGQFLRETIESVLNQNYPNLEYFIIDGGSTDNSVDIIREYEDRIDWWVSEKDDGQSDALIKGFKRATGKLLGWLNSDDVFFPDALHRIGEAYNESPEASTYSGGIAIGEKDNGGIRKCSIPSKPRKMFSISGIIGVGQQCTFFSTDIYRQIGGLNRDLYMRMDGDLFYRLMQYNSAAIVIDDMIGFSRWHETSKSTVSVDRYLQERNEFIKSIENFRGEFIVRNIIFKIYRFFNGGYLKSWLATMQYKGKKMSDIWSNLKC